MVSRYRFAASHGRSHSEVKNYGNGIGVERYLHLFDGVRKSFNGGR
jgi:hypothetical protein